MQKKTRKDKMIEATLKDTEMVLFAPIVEKAVKHFALVDAKVKHACSDFLIKREKLMEAAKKRPEW